MKNRLAWKLILILVGVLLFSGIVSAVMISITTKSAFENLVREGDLAAAEALAERFGEYYRDNGSWRGIEEVFDSVGLMLMRQRMGPGMMGPSRGMPMRRGMGSPEGHQLPGPADRFRIKLLLSDEEGRVVAHTMEETPEELSREERVRQGVPVRSGGSTVGYVFIGSMIDPVLGPFQRAFLGSVYRAITVSTLIAVLLAAAAGLFFVRSVTEPLKTLSTAARGVSAGNYEPVLPEERRDEIGDLSRSFLSMTRSLREADEWKKKIIADSAHELRTPVSVLQGNIEMMLEGVYQIDKKRIEGLQEETRVLSRLVEELQSLANAEKGKGTYLFEELKAGELLRHVYHSASPLATTKEIELRIKDDGQAITLRADRQKLLQAFMNLVHNALYYTPRKGTVLLGAEKNGSEAVFFVEDSGPGIPEEERELVFERFYRLDRARSRESGGSGLGLAIVREIVRAHGGRTEAADAQVLGGSRFVMRFDTAGRFRADFSVDSSPY